MPLALQTFTQPGDAAAALTPPDGDGHGLARAHHGDQIAVAARPDTQNGETGLRAVERDPLNLSAEVFLLPCVQGLNLGTKWDSVKQDARPRG